MTPCAPPPAALAIDILRALHNAELVDAGERLMSLPRLGKQLGQSASVLLRTLSTMGEASFSGQTGPGWVRVEQANGRWTVRLTEAGRSAAQTLAAEGQNA